MDESKFLSRAEMESDGEKETYTVEEVSDILAKIGDMTDEESAQRKLQEFFDNFVKFANRTMEFLNNEKGNLGEALVTWNGRIADRSFRKADGKIMSLEEKIDLIESISDLVFKEGKVKNPQ